MNAGFSNLEVKRNRHTGAVSINTQIRSQPFEWSVEPQKWLNLMQESKSWRASAERRRNLPAYSGPQVHEEDAKMGSKILSTILPTEEIQTAFLREMVELSGTFRFSVFGQDRDLISIPWETCAYPDWQRLHLDPEDIRQQRNSNLVVLRVPVPPRFDKDVAKEPIEILAVASTPRDILPPNYAVEENLIDQSLRLNIREDRYELSLLENFTDVDLKKQLLDQNPHILHVMAHGEDGKLLSADTQSEIVWMDGRRLAAILKEANSGRGLPGKLILFVSTACELMRDTNDSFSREVGPALADLIPFSIGMQLPVSPRVAQRFSQEFYTWVGDSQSVIDSYLHAREELLTRYPGSSSWVAPVLYVASYHDSIFFVRDDDLYRLQAISRGLEEPTKAISANAENKDALERVLAMLLALDEFYENYKNNSAAHRLNMSGTLRDLMDFAEDEVKRNLLYVKKYVATHDMKFYVDAQIPERAVALKKALRKLREDLDKLCDSLRDIPSNFGS